MGLSLHISAQTQQIRDTQASFPGPTQLFVAVRKKQERAWNNLPRDLMWRVEGR